MCTRELCWSELWCSVDILYHIACELDESNACRQRLFPVGRGGTVAAAVDKFDSDLQISTSERQPSSFNIDTLTAKLL